MINKVTKKEVDKETDKRNEAMTGNSDGIDKE